MNNFNGNNGYQPPQNPFQQNGQQNQPNQNNPYQNNPYPPQPNQGFNQQNAPQPGVYIPVPPPFEQHSNGLGIAAFVLGLIGLLTCCFYGAPAIVLGILGLVFGILQNKKHRTGLATAGIVLGAIGLVLGAIYLILIIIGLSVTMSDLADATNIIALTIFK